MPKLSKLLRKCLSDDVAVDVRVDLLSKPRRCSI